jgi:hypothetical protein
MKPRPRIRKTIKWGGAAVAALLVVLWVCSKWWYVKWSSHGGLTIGVSAGVIAIASEHGPVREAGEPGWEAGRGDDSLSWWFDWEFRGRDSFFDVPLWPLVIVFAVGAGFAWYLDVLAWRREHPHLCPKCKYDRTGIAAGVKCPECGASSVSS